MGEIEVSINHQLGDFSLDAAFTTSSSGVTALFGHSGSGKTSVLRAIAGLLRSDKGVVKINGDSWQSETHFLPTHKRPIGYVFQEASLFPHLSVKKNLEYGWLQKTVEQRKISFDDAIELLGITPLLSRTPDKLSGGERQRVAIARALLTSPKLMLMDEPLSALDFQAKQSILPYLDSLHDEYDIPSIYVSHDPKEVARLADKIVLMEKGGVRAYGKASDIMTRVDLPLSHYQDAASILKGHVSAHDPEYHLTWIGMLGGRVAVSRENLSVGKRARVEILARDVSLARKAHFDTSILNILPVRIIDTREISASQLIVRLELEDGQTLLSRVTRRSAMSLELKEGLRLYAQIKSVALLA